MYSWLSSPKGGMTLASLTWYRLRTTSCAVALPDPDIDSLLKLAHVLTTDECSCLSAFNVAAGNGGLKAGSLLPQRREGIDLSGFARGQIAGQHRQSGEQ